MEFFFSSNLLNRKSGNVSKGSESQTREREKDSEECHKCCINGHKSLCFYDGLNIIEGLRIISWCGIYFQVYALCIGFD